MEGRGCWEGERERRLGGGERGGKGEIEWEGERKKKRGEGVGGEGGGYGGNQNGQRDRLIRF